MVAMLGWLRRATARASRRKRAWRSVSVVTGPRSLPCPDNADTRERFSLALQTSLHHEIAVVVLALVVFASWRPWRLFLGAYLFGGVTILQLYAQGSGGFGVPAFGVGIAVGDCFDPSRAVGEKEDAHLRAGGGQLRDQPPAPEHIVVEMGRDDERRVGGHLRGDARWCEVHAQDFPLF